MTTKSAMTNNDIYEAMTAAMIEKIKSGVNPWRRPWSHSFEHAYPTNLKSMKSYRGINVFRLMAEGFDCPYWMTFNQAREMGGMVKKGSKSTMVTFCKKGYKIRDDETGEDRNIMLLRYYRVFNLEQTEGVKVPKRAVAKTEEELAKISESDSIKSAQAIVKGYIKHGTKDYIAGAADNGPSLSTVGSRACYSPTLDSIRMPSKTKFEALTAYYNVLFHEMTHSTGHPKRMNRPLDSMMNKESYSQEELVAEMGAHFLMMEAGIQDDNIADNSAAYLRGWLKPLMDDPKFVVQAASIAQRSVDLIIGRTFGDQEETEEESE